IVEKSQPVNNSISKPKPAKPKTPVQSKPPLNINLKNLKISNVQLIWKSKNKTKADSVLIRNIDSEISLEGNILVATVDGACVIQNMHIKTFPFPSSEFELKSILHYDVDRKNLSIKKCSVSYDEIKANITGSASFSGNRMMNISFNAAADNLNFLSFMMKPEVIKENSDLFKKSSLKINGKVFGEIKNQSPQVELEFGLKNLDIRLPGKKGSFNDIGFEGKFSSGKSKDLSEGQLE